MTDQTHALKPESEGTFSLNTEQLVMEVQRRAPSDGVELLDPRSESQIAQVLTKVTPSLALKILMGFPEARRKLILPEAPIATQEQWARNQEFPEGSIGRLMDPPVGTFAPEMTVREAVARLRDITKTAFITYGYVTDAHDRLLGVLVMRDLLLADSEERLEHLMLRDPFSLQPQASVSDAMQEVIYRHYPVYPVCNKEGQLIGLVRGWALFEEHTVHLSAQPGRMVGVEEEERLATPWATSFRFRHPWLQLNLVTAFVAAFVVGIFEETINQVVALAVFLPVLAGQSGNTGCQSLAVTLRGMTLGETVVDTPRRLVIKEAWLGLVNGSLVGVTAGLAMWGYASLQHLSSAWVLGVVVFLALTGSCVISGMSGTLVPLVLKKLGADPATASSIFLTTATDVVSMGLFLGLATWLVL